MRFQRGLILLVVSFAARAQVPDPVIESARKAAAAYATSLPDYIVKRSTTRLYGARPDHYFPGRSILIWRTLDDVSADLAVEHGAEVYTNISVNGRKLLDTPHGGAWSMGEFSGEVLSILPAERAAKFTLRREEVLRNRPTYKYDFAVDAPHSVWHLSAGHLPGAPTVVELSPAYAGTIWIDKETGEALKIAESARDLPSYFPLDTVESVTDYEFVKIGEGEYLLPTHSETVSCQRDHFTCYKNVTDFRDYDKFGSKSSITFDNGSK